MENETRKTTPAGLAIYRVPELNMHALGVRVAKMNKRAAKLHMEPLVLTEVGEEFVNRTRDSRANRWDEDLSGRPARIIHIRLVLVTLSGTCPRVNGWAMAATIQHDEAGNVLRTVPGFEAMLPLAYRTAPTRCDHCGTNRIRKDTYVLQSESGDWKQVGRNCLADFLRSDNAAGLAEMAEMLAGLDAEMSEYEECESFGGHATHYFATLDLLTQVACVVRSEGWCSRTEAKNSFTSKLATVDAAMACWDPIVWAKMSAADQERLTPTEDDKLKAAGAIEWAQSLPSDVTNDYLWNIRVVSHRERISYREAGLAGSIIAAYNRYLENEMKKKYERDNPSEYFGVVGERSIFTLAVISTREMESDYGLTTLVMFRDPAGNRAKWFCSGSCAMTVDTTYTVKATVKAHEEYKGSKQTMLSRVTVYNAAAEALAKAENNAAKKAAKAEHLGVAKSAASAA